MGECTTKPGTLNFTVHSPHPQLMLTSHSPGFMLNVFSSCGYIDAFIVTEYIPLLHIGHAHSTRSQDAP